MTTPIALLVDRLQHELLVAPQDAAYCRPFSRALVADIAAALERQEAEIEHLRADMQTVANMALELTGETPV